MSTVPPEVRSLVERFNRNREAYKSPSYNETQVRREFIDPLFKALGWDVDNELGYAEACKDVIHEGAIRLGGRSEVFQRQIDGGERQIDQVSYELYDLTDEEIRIVEAATL